MDASHDTHYGPNLPASVVTPLLTREAVNLLMNCVTSKETELWHSLGDAWLVPRYLIDNLSLSSLIWIFFLCFKGDLFKFFKKFNIHTLF